MELNLNIKSETALKRQLILSKQLQFALKFLQVPRLELETLVRAEVETNPMLEEDAEFLEVDADKVKDETTEVTLEERLDDIIDWSNYISEFNTPGKIDASPEQNPHLKNEESYLPNRKTLSEHLYWQLGISLPAEDIQGLNIGKIIIGNLDRNGYLQTDINRIAEIANAEEKKAKEILALLQAFNPPGVCARNLRETLLIQAEALGISDAIALCIIKKHIKELQRKNFTAISKSLKLPIKHIILAANIIKSLEPYPGRAFEDSLPVRYIIPDIYVRKIDGKFIPFYNEDGLPKLRLSNFYKKKVYGYKKMDGETEDYIKKKREAAIQIAQSIHKRKTTICKVAESIIKFQKNFFEKGYDLLKPLNLSDVADDIGMHKSTVSRTVSGKYLHCSNGIFELKYFFTNPVKTIGGALTTSAAIMEKIKSIIKKEPVKSPYDDGKITKILNDTGVKIARRTVSKYRNKMNILPASARKEYSG
ncbi:MAG: RNA polymerase factor sigma-54 [Deltaproteobacteria bacterium]|nr:RNA polymerase factor sigma-54 [Deltaproteobacteria bacterium]